MVDRISKIDSGMHRVQETDADHGGQGGYPQEEEDQKKKDKDKFDKGKKAWKGLVSEGQAQPGQSLTARLQSGEMPHLSRGALSGEKTEPEAHEESLTMSQRILVLWGMIDTTGKPRVPVIITYATVALVILIAVFLILGIFLKGTT